MASPTTAAEITSVPELVWNVNASAMVAAPPGAMAAFAGSVPLPRVVPGCSAIVRKALILDVTVAVVLPVAPAAALTPSHTPKPPPLPKAVPASDLSAMPVRFAFVSALNAPVAPPVLRATA